MGGVTVAREIWHRALTSQQAPPRWVIVGTAVVAILLVGVPGLWRRSRHLVTIAHEGAHGLAALASGRRLAGIRLHADASGLTLSRGRSSGPGMLVTVGSGYIGPALLGLGAAYLLRIGHAVAALWLAMVLLVGLLALTRNWFGLWSVTAAAVAVLSVSWWGSGPVQSGFAYSGAWFLLLASPRAVIEMQTARHRGRVVESDADILARLTHVPGLVWVALFLLVTVASLAIGGRWLIAAH
jgi:hypothetical protein